MVTTTNQFQSTGYKLQHLETVHYDDVGGLIAYSPTRPESLSAVMIPPPPITVVTLRSSNFPKIRPP
ncbi:hypothetical protein CEXT_209561, partial [Caerostris extrusa]